MANIKYVKNQIARATKLQVTDPTGAARVATWAFCMAKTCRSKERDAVMYRAKMRALSAAHEMVASGDHAAKSEAGRIRAELK